LLLLIIARRQFFRRRLLAILDFLRILEYVSERFFLKEFKVDLSGDLPFKIFVNGKCINEVGFTLCFPLSFNNIVIAATVFLNVFLSVVKTALALLR
jgi:hypothetical protein